MAHRKTTTKRTSPKAERVAAPADRVVMPVCWVDGGGTICWGNAIAIELGEQRVVRFDDGGWNRADDCFFTEDQCRRFHDLPPKQWTDQRREIAEKLKEMSEAFSA